MHGNDATLYCSRQPNRKSHAIGTYVIVGRYKKGIVDRVQTCVWRVSSQHDFGGIDYKIARLPRALLIRGFFLQFLMSDLWSFYHLNNGDLKIKKIKNSFPLFFYFFFFGHHDQIMTMLGVPSPFYDRVDRTDSTRSLGF